MGKHNDLDALVGHIFGHVFVGGDHLAAEVFAFSLDGYATATIPDPIGKFRWRVFTDPGDEEVEDFFVFDGITIKWISDENIIIQATGLRSEA